VSAPFGPASQDSQPDTGDEQPLALVRYGLGREIRLFPSEIAFISREDDEEDRFALAAIRQLSLQPGEHIPSKLVILVEFQDGTSIIAGEGMTSVRDFIRMVGVLRQIAPHIALDPPDLEEQLRQAVANRRASNLGCYATVLITALVVLGICVLASLIVHPR
jgi:hypothetical protein